MSSRIRRAVALSQSHPQAADALLALLLLGLALVSSDAAIDFARLAGQASVLRRARFGA